MFYYRILYLAMLFSLSIADNSDVAGFKQFSHVVGASGESLSGSVDRLAEAVGKCDVRGGG
jgi:hypothetical protein